VPNCSELQFVIQLKRLARNVKGTFLAPDTFARGAFGAEQYLVQEFDSHNCEKPKR